jgi:pyruvate/2-oxoacid:ferredoxin oxidoreductase beta subunit
MDRQEMEEVLTSDGGEVWCPGCGNPIPAVVTAYGMRAVCAAEQRRWTRLRVVLPWAEDSWEAWREETYASL